MVLLYRKLCMAVATSVPTVIVPFVPQEGETALYVACKKGYFDVVKVFLEHHADISKECRKVCN